jgi:hypothetical protein
LVKTAPNDASGMCVHLQLIVQDDSEVTSRLDRCDLPPVNVSPNLLVLLSVFSMIS